MEDLNKTTGLNCCFDGKDPTKNFYSLMIVTENWMAARYIQYWKNGTIQVMNDNLWTNKR